MRPVPAQALQMMRWPRSRTCPVPQHRTQVRCVTGAGRLLCCEKRLPNVTWDTPHFSRFLDVDATLSMPP